MSKIHCLANQNKPDNRQRHRVSQRAVSVGLKWSVQCLANKSECWCQVTLILGLRNRGRGLGLGCARPKVAAQGHPAQGSPGLQPRCWHNVYLPHPDDLGEHRPSPRASFGSDLIQMHYITTLNQSLCYNIPFEITRGRVEWKQKINMLGRGGPQKKIAGASPTFLFFVLSLQALKWSSSWPILFKCPSILI